MISGKIRVSQSDLNLKMMLEGGQSFRWRPTGSSTWTGVFRNCVWSIQQLPDHLVYHVTPQLSSPSTPKVKPIPPESYDKLLSEYLRLDFDLGKHYALWSSADPHFKRVAAHCYGIRMLYQDPVENVFSFICSSNNNITRISSMVEKLCNMYGTEISTVNGQTYFTFPKIESLAEEPVEGSLRKAGFGYRAKFIQQSAKKLMSLGGEKWLSSLKELPYTEAKTELIQLPGIGAKVADCICLMSLNHLEAVPVDTHVFQIAVQNYLPHLKSAKTVTDRVYNEIGDHFRNLYGDYAGWAHSVLFCADLKMFKTVDKVTGHCKSGSGKRKRSK